MMTARNILSASAAVLLLGATLSQAHEHHNDRIPEGAVVSPEPLDSILWIHILVQIISWGFIFPTGMVLGMVRSRWHVPTQILGTAGAITGHFLGHAHGGRQFTGNVHSSFAPYLEFILFVQIVLGVSLRLHIARGILGRIRPIVVRVHGFLGKAMPLLGWTQMLFGGITALGFCRADHMGQCLAHFIMGSAFIAYGIILTIMLQVGQPWLRRTGRSQEFYDSIVIAAWGCVNTFTEHHWGGPWVRNDLQHTSIGVIWWAAGLLGIWLSKTKDGRPKRNLVPAVVIILTGYGMGSHPQQLEISTMVHVFFGYTLMSAGITRLIEISFILRDRDALSTDGDEASSFQFLPPFLLISSGFILMSATEEQMQLISDAHITHLSYILILLSFACIMHLFVYILIHVYTTHTLPASSQTSNGSNATSGPRRKPLGSVEDDEEEGSAENEAGEANGHASAGRALSERERRQVRDAQEFELETLISDDEGDGHETRREDAAEHVAHEGRVLLR